jgi:hypothetical protein
MDSIEKAGLRNSLCKTEKWAASVVKGVAMRMEPAPARRADCDGVALKGKLGVGLNRVPRRTERKRAIVHDWLGSVAVRLRI